MHFLRRVVDFVRYPTHTRTLGILVAFVMVAVVSLTVYVAQQQQNLTQKASELTKSPTIIKINQQCPSGTTQAWNDSYTIATTCCPVAYSFYCSVNSLCMESQASCENLLITPTSIPAPTSSPTVNKKAGSICINTNECESGLLCTLINGTTTKTCMTASSSTPQSVSSIPTNTPTPRPASTCVPACKDNQTCVGIDEEVGITTYQCITKSTYNPTSTPTPSQSSFSPTKCGDTECPSSGFHCVTNFNEPAFCEKNTTPACSLKEKGDANGDCKINDADYAIWLDGFFGRDPDKKADFNKDESVNLIDFNIWRDGLLGR